MDERTKSAIPEEKDRHSIAQAQERLHEARLILQEIYRIVSLSGVPTMTAPPMVVSTPASTPTRYRGTPTYR